MVESDKEWQARDDAWTLAQAKQIEADKERYERAQVAVKQLAQEKMDEYKGILRAMNRGNMPKSLPAQGIDDLKREARIANRQGRPRTGTARFNVFKKI